MLEVVRRLGQAFNHLEISIPTCSGVLAGNGIGISAAELLEKGMAHGPSGPWLCFGAGILQIGLEKMACLLSAQERWSVKRETLIVTVSVVAGTLAATYALQDVTSLDAVSLSVGLVAWGAALFPQQPFARALAMLAGVFNQGLHYYSQETNSWSSFVLRSFYALKLCYQFHAEFEREQAESNLAYLLNVKECQGEIWQANLNSFFSIAFQAAEENLRLLNDKNEETNEHKRMIKHIIKTLENLAKRPHHLATACQDHGFQIWLHNLALKAREREIFDT